MITWPKSQYNLYEKRVLRLFAKNYRELFEWEFESVPMGGSQRCQDCCQSLTHCCTPPPTCAAVKTWKHFDRPAPTCCQFLRLLPTPLSECCHCSHPLLFRPFQCSFDFWEVAAPFLGQLAHFMNQIQTEHPLQAPFCCQPIWGCAADAATPAAVVVVFAVVIVVVVVVGGGGPDENKKCKRAMVVLTPWHWLVDCISPFYPLYPSPLNHFIWWHLHLVACSWHQDKSKKKIYIFSRILLLFCSNRYKEMSVTHILLFFLTTFVATYRLFWCIQCAYVADYPGLHIATTQMCWTHPSTSYPMSCTTQHQY